MRRRNPAARLKIDFQILGSGKIRFDANHAVETFGERHSKKADSREQVQRQPSAAVPNHGLNQLINQKPVDLKKRKMTDAKIGPGSHIRQVAWSEQFKLIGAAILHQNRFDTRQGCAQARSNRFWRIGQPFGGEIQQNLLVRRVHEGLNFINREKSFAGSYQHAQFCECFGEPRREYRAFVYGAQASASSLKISDPGRRRSAILGSSNLPLCTIAIAEGRRSVRSDRAVPLHAANPAEGFAKDFCLVAQLRVIRNMLVMAAAATPVMRARSRNTLRGGL